MNKNHVTSQAKSLPTEEHTEKKNRISLKHRMTVALQTFPPSAYGQKSIHTSQAPEFDLTKRCV